MTPKRERVLGRVTEEERKFIKAFRVAARATQWVCEYIPKPRPDKNGRLSGGVPDSEVPYLVSLDMVMEASGMERFEKRPDGKWRSIGGRLAWSLTDKGVLEVWVSSDGIPNWKEV